MAQRQIRQKMMSHSQAEVSSGASCTEDESSEDEQNLDEAPTKVPVPEQRSKSFSAAGEFPSNRKSSRQESTSGSQKDRLRRKISTNAKIGKSSVREGYLLKQRGSFQRWKSRYFKLKGTKLYYAASQDALIFNEIDLVDYSVAECGPKNAHAFQVITPFVSLVLCAETRREMDEWVASLKAVGESELFKSGAEHYRSVTSGEHTWYVCSHARPTYCNACREALSGMAWHGLSCEVCKVKSHKRCAVKIHQKCKWTILESIPHEHRILDEDHELVMPHQWVEGNLPMSVKCAVCEKTCGSILRLQDWRCLWCRVVVHDGSCRDSYPRRCPLGANRLSVLPPVSMRGVEPGGKASLAPTRNPPGSPLLVLVNSKSGDNQGVKVLRRFKRLLNPAQVFDLMSGGPLFGLKLLSVFDSFRVLVCGGDGSVGWVFSSMDKLDLHSKCQLGVLPLGTGNDLARVLGWGNAFDDNSSLPQLIEKFERAHTQMLDRWSVMIYEGPTALKETGKKSSSITQYEDSVATHLSKILSSDDNALVLTSAQVLCETVKDFLSKIADAYENAGDAELSQEESISSKCQVLKQKLDNLLLTLKRESLRAEAWEESGIEPEGSSSDSMPEISPAASKAIQQKNFIQREALMSRANSLKKAVKEIIDHAERAVDEQNRQTKRNRGHKRSGRRPKLFRNLRSRTSPSALAAQRQTSADSYTPPHSPNSLSATLNQEDDTETSTDQSPARRNFGRQISDASSSGIVVADESDVIIEKYKGPAEVSSGEDWTSSGPSVSLRAQRSHRSASSSPFVREATDGSMELFGADLTPTWIEGDEEEATTSSRIKVLPPTPGGLTPSSSFGGRDSQSLTPNRSVSRTSPLYSSAKKNSAVFFSDSETLHGIGSKTLVPSYSESSLKQLQKEFPRRKISDFRYGDHRDRKKMSVHEQKKSLPTVKRGLITSGLTGGSLIAEVLLLNADVLGVAASPLMDFEDVAPEDYVEKRVCNNYFGIGLDAKISLEFHQKREEYADRARSRSKLYMWYGMLGTKELLQRTYRKLEQRVHLECDGQRIQLPSLQGVVILNIQSYQGGANFWGHIKEGSIFSAQSFDDKILEVVAVFSVIHCATSRVVRLANHKIAQCREVKIIITGDEPIPVQVDGEAWMQSPGYINIHHKNRAQVLVRNRQFEATLKAWTEIQSREEQKAPGCLLQMFTEEESKAVINFLDSSNAFIQTTKKIANDSPAFKKQVEDKLEQASATIQRLYPPAKKLPEISHVHYHLMDAVGSIKLLVHHLSSRSGIMGAEDAASSLSLTPDSKSQLETHWKTVVVDLREISRILTLSHSVISLDHQVGACTSSPELTRASGGGFRPKAKTVLGHWFRNAVSKLRSKDHGESYKRNITSWSVDEVTEWLKTIGLEQYQESFRNHEIAGSELLKLERRDLKELGVDKIGHIKRLQSAISELPSTSKKSASSSHSRDMVEESVSSL